MPDDGITFRRARVADLGRLHIVFKAALDDYLVPRGLPPMPDADETGHVTQRHLLRHDGDRLWVAERAGEVVAWSSGLLRGDWWFLASLFVLPGLQKRGLGQALFDRALTGASDGGVRATCTDSLQPVSNTLYARRGLLPREVLVQLAGQPPAGLARPRLGRLVPEPLTAAAVPELAAVDEAAGGVDRTLDHAFYLGAGGRRGWLFRRAGRVVAYAMVRPTGWIGPLACERAADCELVTTWALAELAAAGVEKVSAGVPGPNEGAQRALWAAGLRYELTPGLLLACRPFGHLDRYLPAGYAMF